LIEMKIEDSRKIAQDMQSGIFSRLSLQDQLRIRDMIRLKRITNFNQYMQAVQFGGS